MEKKNSNNVYLIKFQFSFPLVFEFLTIFFRGKKNRNVSIRFVSNRIARRFFFIKLEIKSTRRGKQEYSGVCVEGEYRKRRQVNGAGERFRAYSEQK